MMQSFALLLVLPMMMMMGAKAYRSTVYREPTRLQQQQGQQQVQNQPFSPPYAAGTGAGTGTRRSQDLSGIFSGVERVFEEMNKGAFFYENPASQQTNEWGDMSSSRSSRNNDNYPMLMVDNSFGDDDPLYPRQMKQYEFYTKPTTAVRSGASLSNGSGRNSNFNEPNTFPTRPSADRYYPIGSPREPAMGDRNRNKYNRGPNSAPYEAYKNNDNNNQFQNSRTPWTNEAPTSPGSSSSSFFNKNYNRQEDSWDKSRLSSQRPRDSVSSSVRPYEQQRGSSYPLESDYAAVDYNNNNRNGNPYYNNNNNAPPSNYQSASSFAPPRPSTNPNDNARLNGYPLEPDYSTSPGYVESTYPASNYQPADKWNSFSQLGTSNNNGNTFPQYGSSSPYQQQQQQRQQQAVSSFSPTQKDNYYSVGRNEPGVRSPTATTRYDSKPSSIGNQPGPLQESTGTKYYPLQPDYSAHLDPGRNKYNVKDHRRQNYNTQDEPGYQPRSSYSANWGRDSPYSSSPRFTYQDSDQRMQRDRRDDTERNRHDNVRKNDNDSSPGWWKWLLNLGRF